MNESMNIRQNREYQHFELNHLVSLFWDYDAVKIWRQKHQLYILYK
jgi:hypothetical protein